MAYGFPPRAAEASITEDQVALRSQRASLGPSKRGVTLLLARRIPPQSATQEHSVTSQCEPLGQGRGLAQRRDTHEPKLHWRPLAHEPHASVWPQPSSVDPH